MSPSRCLLGLVLPLLGFAASLDKPDKLSIHTWVREDVFAGWIARDLAALTRGAAKVERFLERNPGDENALAWKYLVKIYEMRQAQDAKDVAAYDQAMATAAKIRDSIWSGRSPQAGAHIIVGSMLVAGAYWARETDKPWMYRDGRELLRKVPDLQKGAFDTLPPHMRGELWSSIAFASDRLGDKDERDRVVELMLTQLKGSLYEKRAQRWQKLPALTSEVDNMCISCHEPGRLKPTAARLGVALAE
jgi:hypothetical protein